MFSKSPLQRFNEKASGSPPPNKYGTQQINRRVKGPVPYNNQKLPRFHSPGLKSNKSVERYPSSSSRSIQELYGYGVQKTPQLAEPSEEEIETVELSESTAKIMSGTPQALPPSEVHETLSQTRSQSSISKKSVVTNNETSTTKSLLSKRKEAKKSFPTDRQNKRGFEIQFFTKKKSFVVIKKELEEKQRQIMDLHASMTDIRKRVLKATGKDLGPIEEFKLIEVGNLKMIPSKVKLPSADIQSNKRQFDGTGEYINEPDPHVMAKLENMLQEIPLCYMQLCHDVISERDSIYDSLENLKCRKNIIAEDKELQELCEKHKQEGDGLYKKLEETKQMQLQTISDIIRDVKNMGQLKETANDHLDKDKNELCRKVDLLEVENKDLIQKLQSYTEELEAERNKNRLLTYCKSTTDVQLKTAHQKVREMGQKLSTDETRITELTNQMKELEVFLKRKETAFDQKTKEMQRINKTTTEQVKKLENQRNSLESRVLDLKKSLNEKENEALILQNNLNEACERIEEEHKLRINKEMELDAMSQSMMEVDEKNRQLAEMGGNIADNGAEGREGESDLLSELKTTRALLKKAENQIAILKEEKEKFLDVLNEAIDQDEQSLQDLCARYGTEVVKQTQEIKQLKDEIEEMKNSLATSQKQKSLLEEQLKESQEKLSKQEINNAKEIENQNLEFQHQVHELQTTLSQVIHKSKQLEHNVSQKQQEIEQKDRVMHEQSRVLKVRDELIRLLKGKEQQQEQEVATLQSSLEEQQQNTEKVKKEVIEKVDEMQQLYSTLERKQIQVMHLEKIVKKMEEQQERVQAQRKWQETRIAQLEHALEEKQTQRGSKFPFF